MLTSILNTNTAFLFSGSLQISSSQDEGADDGKALGAKYGVDEGRRLMLGTDDGISDGAIEG